MRNFQCRCGQTLFFENTECLSCGERVGFDPRSFSMGPVADRKLCQNGIDYDVCNWFVAEKDSTYCISCSLNQTIPNLMDPKRRRWWKSLEIAKRRLIYSLLRLKLPVVGKQQRENGLAFQFIEDKRTNPDVYEDHVNTGHLNGLITVNIAEADEVTREISRQFSGELYRTLLGHFRHESGHYYFHELVEFNPQALETFRQLFGDETADYAAALEYYYANRFTLGQGSEYISHYSQSHPLEDWAEVWAHYLHMFDTLETARQYHMQQGSERWDDIDELLLKWSELSVMLNALNRSMGLEDAYPFTITGDAIKKLRFVHDLIYPS